MAVEFDEPNIIQRNNEYMNSVKKSPAMIRWLLKNGIVKTEKAGANLLLIGSLIFLVVSVILIMNANGAFQGENEQNTTIKELVDQGYSGPQLIEELNRRNAK